MVGYLGQSLLVGDWGPEFSAGSYEKTIGGGLLRRWPNHVQTQAKDLSKVAFSWIG